VTATPGASVEAIEAHYDLGNDFFQLWLDESMTYTCALWAGPEDTLEAAQARKIDFLLECAGARGANRLLDVGCGWGGAMKRAVSHFGVQHAHGLSLSRSQSEWVPAPGVTVAVENWLDHRPDAPYDAIISVEAFEAFAKLGLPPDQKAAVYRRYFESCHAWLAPGGSMALQTIAYGNSGPEDFDAFIATEIFPESDLPTLAELGTAISRRFELVALHNRRHDYARTLREWLARLKRQRARAVDVVGEAVVVRFERYLRLSIYMFEKGTCDLYQLHLRRIDQPRGTS
jgi:cyclopropane-fatty-acyl-phospholipid synthase